MPAISIGVSQSSMAGDKSYSATSVIFANLKQFVLSGGYTKMDFSEGKLNAINSYSVTTAYLDKNLMEMVAYTWIKPHPKYGTYGYNVGVIALLLQNENKTGYNLNLNSSLVTFWTKPYQTSKKLTVSPQVFLMFAPIAYNAVSGATMVNRNMGFLIGSSFDYKISKRFALSFNYKLSGNTMEGAPLLSNFLIGSRVAL
jgi:hypothetical protein